MDVEKNLAALGIVLPAAPAPAANYLPWVITGNQLWIAGQAPLRDGKSIATGRVGEAVTLADAQAAARQCGINILAQVKAACAGDWSRITRCVRLCGYVSSAPAFHDQPAVVDGASNLMFEVLGEIGKHVRSAVGANSLRGNVPVVVDAVFEIRA